MVEQHQFVGLDTFLTVLGRAVSEDALATVLLSELCTRGTSETWRRLLGLSEAFTRDELNDKVESFRSMLKEDHPKFAYYRDELESIRAMLLYTAFDSRVYYRDSMLYVLVPQGEPVAMNDVH